MIDHPAGRHKRDVMHADQAAPLRRDSDPSSAGLPFRHVQAVAAPDDEKLRELVRDHFGFIWRSLRRLGVQARDADDAAQRTFWVASQKLDAIEAGKERAFLFGTATLVAHEFRRKARRTPELSDADADAEVVDPSPSPEELVDRRRARSLLDEVLDAMPLEQRTVFVLFEFEELSVPEIAVLVDAKEGTVASRLRRARELFRVSTERLRARASFRGGT
jgi:RNA polymerase sigma-70 factor, ECF subfamily